MMKLQQYGVHTIFSFGTKLVSREDPMQMGDRCIRVTIHHCFFDSMRPIYAVQQGPPLQQNYTRDWGIYAVCDIVKAQMKTVFKYMPEKVPASSYKMRRGCCCRLLTEYRRPGGGGGVSRASPGKAMGIFFAMGTKGSVPRLRHCHLLSTSMPTREKIHGANSIPINIRCCIVRPESLDVGKFEEACAVDPLPFGRCLALISTASLLSVLTDPPGIGAGADTSVHLL
nr:uncharacterized protein LOC109778648 isoform X4 [Aegilops tauschii subsp. strangulata]XP_045091069.1 uncharacterized protein LOC109778648 isoform X4 [Aegilops tauschii subsp. strangulata]XP_045091070.1 uncharacterized protein LOC109778648 isoform X4 [Aegilops tauschii subsp. strangulata]XP_045091071.1 uncharacterized protein LOC109778648 isoform X4 [Aegilops tauschii subsp. strangulata]